MFAIGSFVGGACTNCDDPEITNKKLNPSARLQMALAIGDLFSITAFVIGIIAVTGKISGLPPAAAYVGIGVGGLAVLYWGLILWVSKGKMFTYLKVLFQSAVSSHPKEGKVAELAGLLSNKKG